MKVNGVQAQYWPGGLNAQDNTASTSRKMISVTTSADQMGALLWTDPETKINFRFEIPYDRDTMIPMVENISPK